MIKIGITGGIGCGKSVVANLLRERGFPIIDADKIAKEIIKTNVTVKNRIIDEFGPDVYAKNGTLDRYRMAEIIFSQPDARKKLNAIVHPFVIDFQNQQLQQYEQKGVAIAGVEAALIFEAHAERHFDVIIVVSAPSSMVIERIHERDDLSISEITNRIQSQMPVAEKIKRADYVVSNDGTIDDLKEKVRQLIDWLSKKAME